MTLVELTKEATSLPHEERASLVSVLLSTLEPPSYEVTDEEVERRRLEAESDSSVMISFEELKANLGK